jgi:hypothetical protein
MGSRGTAAEVVARETTMGMEMGMGSSRPWTRVREEAGAHDGRGATPAWSKSGAGGGALVLGHRQGDLAFARVR